MENEDKLDYIINQLKEERKEAKDWRKDMEKRVDKAEHQLYLYKSLIALVKWTVGVLIAILTLKFGDLGKYFS